MSYVYQPPQSVRLHSQGHAFLEHPPVPIRPMGSFFDAAGVSATTGSGPLDVFVKYGLWIGLGLVSYRMYRVLRYDDPFIQPSRRLPPAWQANGRRTKADMDLILGAVKKQHEEGATISEIAQSLGVHKVSVGGYLKKLGLRPHARAPRVSPELRYTHQRVLELYEPKMNIHDLAFILDSNMSTIVRWLKGAGIYVPAKKGGKEPLSRMSWKYKMLLIDRENERKRREKVDSGWQPSGTKWSWSGLW